MIRYQFLQISHVLCLLHPFHHTEFGEGDVKNTHTRTHFSSAKRVGRFPRWYGLPPILLPLLLSHITHTYLTITSPLSGRCPCMLTCELTASIKIQRTHFCPLPYYVTLHCITYLFLTVVWWRSWCRSSANTAKNWTESTASTGANPHWLPPFCWNRSDFS